MAKTILEYSWRTESLRMMRSGFAVLVEKFWCTEVEGDADGWRWSGHAISSDKRGFDEPSVNVSATMSRAEATERAEQWIADQIEQAKGLGIYAFAGLEATP